MKFEKKYFRKYTFLGLRNFYLLIWKIIVIRNRQRGKKKQRKVSTREIHKRTIWIGCENGKIAEFTFFFALIQWNARTREYNLKFSPENLILLLLNFGRVWWILNAVCQTKQLDLVFCVCWFMSKIIYWKEKSKLKLKKLHFQQ